MTLAEIAGELHIPVDSVLSFDQTLRDRADVRDAVRVADWAALDAVELDDEEAQDLINAYRERG